MMYSSLDFKGRARKALRPIFSIALLTALCAKLPGLLASMARTMTEGPMAEVLYAVQSDRSMSLDQMMSMLAAAMTKPYIAALVFTAVVVLAGHFLTLGYDHYLLKTLRGQEGDVSDVLSRLPIFFKAVGQQLYMLVKILLWMVPAMAVMFGMTLAAFMIPNAAIAVRIVDASVLVNMVLSTALMLRAFLHYSMAEFVMADHPEVGIRASVKESIRIMRTRKMQLFMLSFSFVGLNLLILLAQIFLNAISPVVGMTLGSAASLAVQLYMNMSFAAFYELYRDHSGDPVPETPADAAQKE